jgi:hypothetical protein
MSCTNSRLSIHPKPSPDTLDGPCDIWSRHCRSLGRTPLSDFAFCIQQEQSEGLVLVVNTSIRHNPQRRRLSTMARFAEGLPAHLWIAVFISLSYSCFTGFLRIYPRVGYYGIDDIAIAFAHVSVHPPTSGWNLQFFADLNEPTRRRHLAQLSFFETSKHIQFAGDVMIYYLTQKQVMALAQWACLIVALNNGLGKSEEVIGAEHLTSMSRVSIFNVSRQAKTLLTQS